LQDLSGVKRSTQTRPQGDHVFVKKIEKLTGRMLHRENPDLRKNKKD